MIIHRLQSTLDPPYDTTHSVAIIITVCLVGIYAVEPHQATRGTMDEISNYEIWTAMRDSAAPVCFLVFREFL